VQSKYEQKSFSHSDVNRWSVRFVMVSPFARLLSAFVCLWAQCISGLNAVEGNGLTALISTIERAVLRGHGTALAWQRSAKCSTCADS